MEFVTYQLTIVTHAPMQLTVGMLGECYFPHGRYIYTGSAKRNLEARIARHLSKKPKRMHWHIDYLLAVPEVEITGVERFSEPECQLNQQVQGAVVVPKFGASDCRVGCGSHLKFLGK